MRLRFVIAMWHQRSTAKIQDLPLETKRLTALLIRRYDGIGPTLLRDETARLLSSLPIAFPPKSDDAMNEAKVVVAIVTYKSAELTVDCLQSINAERQSASGIDIRAIVVDNASGDAPFVSEAIQKNDWSSWVTLLEAPKNGGFAYGNNLAFRRAYDDGPPAYFHMLNPDSIIRRGAIAALVRFLSGHPDVGIAGSSFEVNDGTDWPYAFRFPSILGELTAGLQLGLVTRALQPWVVIREMTPVSQPVDWVGGASMMVRKEVLDAIGGLDEQYFLYFEETDFCYRARQAGFSTWYVPDSRVLHIGQQSTKAAKEWTTPKRLPGYWFDSRCHYFTVNHGSRYAIAADVVALLANWLGSLKRILQHRADRNIPHFLSDFLEHSTLWPRNRGRASVRQIPRFAQDDALVTRIAPLGDVSCCSPAGPA
jgi:GT2 family glycosyltransferase